jgi:hypothetical protein
LVDEDDVFILDVVTRLENLLVLLIDLEADWPVETFEEA